MSRTLVDRNGSSVHGRKLLVLALGTLAILAASSAPGTARAEEDPAIAEIPGAAAAPVPSRALEFARKDLARLEARVDALRQAAEAAAAKLAAIDKADEAALKAATEEKAAADKELTAIDAKATEVERRVALLGTAAPKAEPTALKEVGAFKHTRPILALRVDPAGEFLFAGAQDNQLQKWDLAFGTQKLIPGHRTWIQGMNFASSRNLFISGDYTGKVIWWNPEEAEMKPLREIAAHKGYARAVSISPDRQYVATSGNDNMVRIWSAADGALVKELPGHERHVYNVAFDPTGKYLVSGDLMGILKQWDASSWTLLRDLDCKVLTKYDPTFQADCGGIRGIDFSPDGQTLVVSGISEVSNAFAGIGKPTAVTFRLDTGERQKVMLPKDNFDGSCWGVRYDPAGQFIVGAGGGGSGGMWFWKPDEEKSFHFVKLPAVAYDLCFHPDGLRLAVGLYDNTIRLYDLGPSPAPAKPAETPKAKKRG